MTTTEIGAAVRAAGGADVDVNVPLPIISADTHIGPRLAHELRPYCPKELLDEFDTYAEQQAAAIAAAEPGGFFGRGRPGFAEQLTANLATAGHYDMEARLRDMDEAGITAEVIFHGSQNDEQIPFGNLGFFFGSFLGDMPSAENLAKVATGVHMFNQWLADAVSIQPHRHVGCAQLPSWDVDASVKELDWAHEHGLRSVNWPTARFGVMEFDDPKWEPIWARCAEYRMPLTTHAGAVVPGLFDRDPGEVPYGGSLVQLESGGWPARRGMQRMLISGVFERHPTLKVVLTEIAGGWWPALLEELDSSYLDNYAAMKATLPHRPSEYLRANVFVGASFISAAEAADAVERGYSDHVLWGDDYPHPEGSWAFDDVNRTRKHLRYAFAGLPGDRVKSMISTNAAQVYNLDVDKLTEVATQINSPTLAQIDEPLPELPKGYSKAFRQNGPWS